MCSDIQLHVYLSGFIYSCADCGNYCKEDKEDIEMKQLYRDYLELLRHLYRDRILIFQMKLTGMRYCILPGLILPLVLSAMYL